jgi:hypothetical protein
MATFNRLAIDKLAYSKGGVELREIGLVDNVLDSHFGTKKSVTVVKQSIKPDTSVMRGTAIDVVLAITDDLPLKVFPRVPKAWAELPIKTIAEAARRKPEILELLGTHESIETLSGQERETFTAFVAGTGGDAQELDTAFDATRNAHLLFGG